MVLIPSRSVRWTGAFAPSVAIGSLHPGLTRRRRAYSRSVAVLIPGNGVLETTTIGGTATFFNIYQNVLRTLALCVAMCAVLRVRNAFSCLRRDGFTNQQFFFVYLLQLRGLS